MTRQEYIGIIEKSLVGKIDSKELKETIEYYNDYIYTEMQKGLSEEDVLERLGNPRLLAKSIISANEQKVSENVETVYSETEEEEKQHSFRIPLPVVLILILLLIFLIGYAAVSIIGFLLPIVLPILLIVWIIKAVKKFMN